MFSKIIKYDEIELGEPFPIDVSFKNEEKNNEIIDESELGDEPEFEDLQLNAENLLEEAKLETQNIIGSARIEAEKIIESAKNEAELLFKTSKSDGFKQGYEEGQAKGYEEKKKIIEEAEEIKLAAENLFEETVNSMEDQIIDLILALAKKVIGYEMLNNRDYVISLIQEVVKLTNNHKDIKIRVSDLDYEAVNDKRDEINKLIDDVQDLIIIEDNAMEKGEVVLETSYGSINNSVNKKIEKIKESFKG